MEERGGKPPVHRARSGTVGGASSPAGVFGGPRKPGGYHSEGYFSSDQDEDAPRKTGETLVKLISLSNYIIRILVMIIFRKCNLISSLYGIGYLKNNIYLILKIYAIDAIIF